MYERLEESYSLAEGTVSNILKDEANPLNQIVIQIPSNVTVLDIGAGNGLLGQLFQASGKTIIIDGVEPSDYASQIAKKHYRKLFNGCLSSFVGELKNRSYDYIVLADVIEHIVDPVEFIGEIKSIMHDNTKLIFSIPNVAYGSIRINLLFGEFQYSDSGILEKTHLRFYTEPTVRDLMNCSGLNIEQLSYLHRDIFAIEKSSFLNKINLSSLLSIMSDDNAHTYQFLLVTNKSNKRRADCITVGRNKHSAYFRILNFKFSLLKIKVKKLIRKILNER